MKAILVIDVGENVDFKKDFAKIRLFTSNGRGISYYDKVKLKPMPERKYIRMACNSDGERWAEYSTYDMGYNKCIYEILGEEE